jgi:predicted PurR-regulated permease PerM
MNSPVQVSHSLRVFIGVVLTIAVLRYAEDVFIPLALAVLMTFVLAPIVDWLHRWRINRVVAVVVSVTVAVALICALLYVVFSQFTDLVQELPRYRRQLRGNLADLAKFLRGGMSDTSQAVEQLSREIARVAPRARASGIPSVQVIEQPPGTVESLRNLIAPLLKPVGTAAVVIVFAIFMLLRLHDLRDRLIRLLGSENLRTTTEALTDAAQRVSRYLLMQTLINAWQGFWVTVGLWYIGVPNAMLWGALTVVLRFIPYIGPWLAAIMPVALSLAVFDDWTKPLLVVALFIVLELISNMVLEPWLYGKRTGVSPLALLIAATFWTWLWGTVGLFLAIPLTVCVMVMGKHIPQLNFLYVLLGDDPVLDPHEQLYQRLLAGNREEAEAVLIKQLQRKSPRKVADEVLLAAVRLAEKDHVAGSLGEPQRRLVHELLECWEKKLSEVRTPLAALRRIQDCRVRLSSWKGNEQESEPARAAAR